MDNHSVPGRVNLLQYDKSGIRFSRRTRNKHSYNQNVDPTFTSVRDYVLDIIWSKDHACRVGSLCGHFGEPGNLERETLTVGRVPVEGIDLRT